MARKILITNDSSHVKKCVAQMLVRKALALWVEHNVSIRRLTVREAAEYRMLAERHDARIRPGLAPAEVSGCHFQLPQSSTWRAQHRKTVLGFELVEDAQKTA